jgi:hypothetical protein
MPNNGYDANGFYIIPNADGTVGTELNTTGPCNYAPVEPCNIISSPWSEVALEDKPYEKCVWNWNRAMCLLDKLTSNSSGNLVAALDSGNITLTTDQSDAITDSIYQSIANL